MAKTRAFRLVDESLPEDGADAEVLHRTREDAEGAARAFGGGEAPPWIHVEPVEVDEGDPRLPLA